MGQKPGPLWTSTSPLRKITVSTKQRYLRLWPMAISCFCSVYAIFIHSQHAHRYNFSILSLSKMHKWGVKRWNDAMPKDAHKTKPEQQLRSNPHEAWPPSSAMSPEDCGFPMTGHSWPRPQRSGEKLQVRKEFSWDVSNFTWEHQTYDFVSWQIFSALHFCFIFEVWTREQSSAAPKSWSSPPGTGSEQGHQLEGLSKPSADAKWNPGEECYRIGKKLRELP